MMYLEFKKDKWSMDALTYAGSVRFPAMPDMEQREDYIEKSNFSNWKASMIQIAKVP